MQHFVIVQTLAGICGRSNLPGFLLDVSQFHIYIVMIIVASRSLRYLLIFKAFRAHRICPRQWQGIPALTNHRSHPKANGIGAGNSKPSCLKDNHRKGRTLEKVSAPVISDRKLQLRFNRHCKLKWWLKSAFKARRLEE